MSSTLNPLEVERLIIASSLAYGALTVWYCPCGNPSTGEGFMSCHLPHIILATTLPLGLIIYLNRNNLSNY